MTTTALTTTVATTLSTAMQSVQVAAASIRLYLNPVVLEVTLSLNQETANVNLAVLDIKGAVVLDKQYSGISKQLKLNAVRLKPRTYFVRLQTTEWIETLRFVKL